MTTDFKKDAWHWQEIVVLVGGTILAILAGLAFAERLGLIHIG